MADSSYLGHILKITLLAMVLVVAMGRIIETIKVEMVTGMAARNLVMTSPRTDQRKRTRGFGEAMASARCVADSYSTPTSS
jgi:hypothetical protein